MGVQPPHILLVDDEPAIRLTLSALLKRTGYSVVAAATGEEALALLDVRAYDLVLLDLIMPGIGGLDLARETQRRLPDTAILVLTGSDALEDVSRSGFDYILKTASPQDVLARVAAVLAARRSRAVGDAGRQ